MQHLSKFIPRAVSRYAAAHGAMAELVDTPFTRANPQTPPKLVFRPEEDTIHVGQ